MDTLANTIRQRLCLLMEEKGKNTYQVSVESEVTYSLLNDLVNETGRIPRIDQVIKLCRYFGCSVDFLIGQTDGKSLDPTLKAAAQYTGLSEDAVTKLHEMAKGASIPDKIGNDPKQYIDSISNAATLHALSKLISHEKDSGFLSECALFVSTIEDLLFMKSEHPSIPDDFSELAAFVISDRMEELSPVEARDLRKTVSAQAKRIPLLQARLFYALRETALEEVKRGELSPWSNPDT